MLLIRDSHDGDIDAIADIYAHHVLCSTGTFEVDPPSATEMARRRAEVLGRSLPWLVLEEGGVVLGYTYCNWFKPRPAYRFSAEDSIYLHPGAHGRGLARALLAELGARAQRAGVRKLIAVIGDAANASSIGAHRACGYLPVGVIAACGWKFGRWLDIVLMEKSLGFGASQPASA
ncbi:MAG: GNAT family N-acetyltransferase [Burkholderiaceae bacterium]|jgi:phosphinothricin acetyltransferase|nr:GNAT family N-acetyltransferase [Burkholderiaceae bacterium]